MEQKSWQCPFCGNHATIRDEDVSESKDFLHSGTSDGGVVLHYAAVKCPNKECRRVTLHAAYLAERTGKYGADGTIKMATPIKEWQLLPESDAKPQPDCVPQLIQKDYYEACLIKDKSPKASATLSRRCLQAMIRDFWKIKDKNNLAQEIEAIKGEVDPDTWNAIQAVREFGNIGAHMEKDVNLILNIEPQEALALIGLLEILFKDWYIAKEGRKNALKGIVEMAQQKKPRKEQSSTDSAPPENEPE